MNTPHKHAALIKAWAEGQTIQCKFVDGEWANCDANYMLWSNTSEYRLKPTPHPKQEFINAVNQGKQIQYLSRLTENWTDFTPVSTPVKELYINLEWRIKPEDIVSEEWVELLDFQYDKPGGGKEQTRLSHLLNSNIYGAKNVQFTFDAITHQLKDVKLIAP